MALELSLMPNGQLAAIDAGANGHGEIDAAECKQIAAAFSLEAASGLFKLAATKANLHLSPSLAYWREFSSQYLSELCRTTDTNGHGMEAIAPPSDGQLMALLFKAPPMRGGEYLSLALLKDAWNDLDSWVRDQVAISKQPLSAWLKQHAPIWHQVGRVCFHLAENKRDEEFPFAFLATYAPGVSASGRVQYQPLSKALQEFAGEQNKQALLNLLTPVFQASERSLFVKQLVDSNDIFHPLMWTPGEAYQFLQDIPLMESSGLLVRVPDWWRARPRPRVSVTIGDQKKTVLNGSAMLDFHMSVALGDQALTKQELQELMRAQDGLVLLKGQWVEVDRQRLAEALAHWQMIEKQAASGEISFVDGMRLLAGAAGEGLGSGGTEGRGEAQWAFVNAGNWLADTLAQLREPARLGDQQISKSFRGTLRPYQQVGHTWLRFTSGLGLGACLADDMGLGKTVQVLALLLSLKEEAKQPRKPSLLVLPASLLGNWKAEIQQFAPSLSALFVHPSEGPAEGTEAVKERDLVITTYGMLLRQEWLLQTDWRLVILDEAQAIKNPSSQQSKAVRKLKSESRLALTGTPVENRLGDLWSLFDFLCPGLLGSAERFKQFVRQLDEKRSYAPLRALVSPYILRRLKTDKSIIADLPDKTESTAYCGLAREQAALYSRAVKDLERILHGASGIQRRGIVLAFLLKFKQICNHPSQLLGDGTYDPAHSGKFQRLKDICEEIASRQQKVLVFTQFRELTDPIASFLTEVFGSPGLVLHGGTAVSKRKSLVDTFQQQSGPPFMVLSLKAGGTGLNLTAASHVVHFDRWWNPAVENQATDRAYRIGQHCNVMVHKFVCRGTIEEKIDKLIADKVELADSILKGGAESLLTQMSDRELIDMVTLDIDRVSME